MWPRTASNVSPVRTGLICIGISTELSSVADCLLSTMRAPVAIFTLCYLSPSPTMDALELHEAAELSEVLMIPIAPVVLLIG